MTRTLSLAALALVMSASLALAQDAATLRQACAADVQKLCAGIQPGGGRILQCMRTHKAELSPDCQTALANAKAKKQSTGQ